MSLNSKKRCRRMLQLASEVSDSAVTEDSFNTNYEDLSVPKYRRVYQRMQVREDDPGNKVKIQSIQIFNAPGTSKDNSILYETPKRRKIGKISDIYDSPSTGTTFHVMKNAFQTTPTLKNLELSTPVSVRHLTTTRTTTPKSINIYKKLCSTSRCSSVSDLSCANFLACPLSDEQVTDLLMEKENKDFESPSVSASRGFTSVLTDKQVEPYQFEDYYNNNTPNMSPKNVYLGKVVLGSTNEEPGTVDKSTHVSSKTNDLTEKVCTTISEEPPALPVQNSDKSDSEDDADYAPSESTETESSLSDVTSTLTDIDSDLENEALQANNASGDNRNEGSEWLDIDDNIPDLPEFSGGCTINVPESAETPYDFYKLFVCDEIIEKMVTETNSYAQEYINKTNLKPKSRLRNWKPTDIDEMKRFLGVLMAMGLTRVPSLNDYWSKKSLYKNDYIISIMKRDRFLMLLKFWHFSDMNSTEKLEKVKDMYLMLLERFQRFLKPGKFLIIDESMIPWRGRLSFRQYIKNKSHKYGIKLYKLCTPEGYTFNLIIYSGKGDSGREMDHGKKTVMRLTKDLLKEGRIVVTDNFYNSIGLAEELLQKKTFICGTLRPNRKGLPKQVISSKLKKGEIIGKMNRNRVRVVKWHDKRPVYMISTCRNHNTTLKNTGKKKRGTEEEIKKPQCVLTYNDNKKGIDYSDQMASYYTPLKRGLKWFRKVMMELLFGTALVNSWLVFNWGKENRMSKKEFYEAVIEAFTLKPMGETSKVSSRIADLKKKHTFEKKGEKKRRCVGCYAKKRETMKSRDAAKKIKKILSYCKECQKSMCVDCFYNLHF